MWVFGMCDTSHTPALGVMEIVRNCSATPLLPILQQHLRSGTTVHSDQWAAYNHAQQLPSVTAHSTVNHSLHFVDPATGVHTQTVESYWNRVKGKFRRMKGVREDMLPSYLDEFMWRERHGRTASTALNNLFRDFCLRESCSSSVKWLLFFSFFNQLFSKLPNFKGCTFQRSPWFRRHYPSRPSRPSTGVVQCLSLAVPGGCGLVAPGA